MGLNQSISTTSKTRPLIKVESSYSPGTIQRTLEALEDVTRRDADAISRDILHLFQFMEQWYDGTSHDVHGVLHRVAKVCYSQQITDSDVVCQLLEYVNEFGESYQDLVEKIEENLMPETKGQFEVLKYFLQQANCAHMRLGGRPFVDSFCILADFGLIADLGEINFQPELMKVFLQHGAMMPDRNVHAEIIFRSCLQLLYHSCLVQSCNVDEEATQSKAVCMQLESQAPRVYAALACMNLLLRHLRHIQIVKVGEWIVVLEGWSRFDYLEYDRYLQRLVDSRLCPAFRRRHFDPPELKHLCRYAIRERLWKYFGLPHHIFRLPITEEMMAYLNLECD